MCVQVILKILEVINYCTNTISQCICSLILYVLRSRPNLLNSLYPDVFEPSQFKHMPKSALDSVEVQRRFLNNVAKSLSICSE